MVSKAFIPITVEELRRLERIVQSGLKGTHLLFTNEMIREAFGRSGMEKLLQDEIAQGHLQKALATLARSQHLYEQQQLIESLDAKTRAVLVHLYFGLLDQLERRRGDRAEHLN